ncbi:MAG TPA: hypothetical protein VMU34_24045 [Mycobacterium sp.]|nr:hypothetical protein [Mycobacterium sp.]
MLPPYGTDLDQHPFHLSQIDPICYRLCFYRHLMLPCEIGLYPYRLCHRDRQQVEMPEA